MTPSYQWSVSGITAGTSNATGHLKWSYTTGDYIIWSSPAIAADGTVYVSSLDLYAINADGSLKWSYVLGTLSWSSPSIGSDGTVYVGSYNRKLFAIQ